MDPVQVVAMVASGIATVENADEYKHLLKVAEMVRDERRGLVYCGICAKGSFTKRGFYLHLMRVHYEDIKHLLKRVRSRA